MPTTVPTGAVVLHYRNVQDTLTCLRSILAGEVIPQRIILVNNDGNPDLSALFSKEFPELEVLTPPRNLGYGRGMNLGIEPLLKDKSIRYIWCVGNDLKIRPECLKSMLHAFGHDTTIVGVCPIVESQHQQILSAGAIALPMFALWLPIRKKIIQPTDVPILEGSCPVFRSEALQRTGLFDPIYFANVEDVDLSLRLRQNGGRLICVPTARVEHKVAESKGGQFGALNIYLSSRNWTYLVKKLYGWPLLLFILPLMALSRTSLVSLWALKSRKSKLFGAHFRGLWDGFMRAPSTFEERTLTAIRQWSK